MYKIAVIGDKNSVLAFKALGIDVFTVTDELESTKNRQYPSKKRLWDYFYHGTNCPVNT